MSNQNFLWIILIILIQFISKAGYVQDFHGLKISLIQAEHGDHFFIDSEIQSLKNVLEKAGQSVGLNQFHAIATKKKEDIEFGNSIHIHLSGDMYLELNIEPMITVDEEPDYYPITVRWFYKMENEEKDILKTKKRKLLLNSSLLLAKSASENAKNAQLIAIEFLKTSETIE